MEKDIYKVVARLLKEGAPGREHERLKADLAEWATARGYGKIYSKFDDGSIPDALRATAEDTFLMVGDAKDATSETIDDSATVSRIWGYIRNFAAHLSHYKGGYIAVATNSAEEAAKWAPALNTLAQAATLTDGQGRRPNFQIDHFKPRTWIIWW